MPGSMKNLTAIFDSRLATLDALLKIATEQLGEEKATTMLGARLAPDMFPLGRQISIVGNLPVQFVQWCDGEDSSTVDVDIASLSEAHAHIAQSRQRIAALTAGDERFSESKFISLPGDIKFTLSGMDYANDWTLPSFYFHLVTVYNILRANGVQIGKQNYMMHLMPTIMQQMTAAPSP